MTEDVNIYNELKALNSSELIKLDKKNLYTYPKDYFNDLCENILTNIRLQFFSVLTPYTVPDKYFENLPELILDKLQLNHSDVLSTVVYKVPENYFDDLAGNILKKIKKENDFQEELENLSPLLSKLPKTNVYTIPEGYFENQYFIKQKSSSAKLISIGAKSRKWFNYAAAACVAAVMLLGGYFYSVNKSSNNNVIQNQYADINIKTAISQLSDSTINNYLRTDNTGAYANQNPDNEDLNIQTLIENTSDEEIENYLIQNPDPEDQTKGI